MKYILIIVITFLIFSCNQREDRIQVVDEENLTQKEIDSVLDEYSFEYSRVVFIDSLEKFILPISTQRARGGSRLSSGSYYADSYPQYWNFVFYDIASGKTKLLTKEKSRISEFRTNLQNVGPTLKKSVLYEICVIDYDNDNKLTYSDPSQLYISDINGENLTRLSPEKEDILEYLTVPNTDKIVFQTRRDTNDDRIFDKKDELIWYLIDLSNKNRLTEIIKPSDRKEIENLYFKQWLVKGKEK